MKLDYKTDRLPLNFITLGYLLSAIGVWRLIVFDWKGLLYLLLSIFLIFFKSGIIIDSDKKLLRKYNGIFFIKKGSWENINQLTGLQIVKSKETRQNKNLSQKSSSMKTIVGGVVSRELGFIIKKTQSNEYRQD